MQGTASEVIGSVGFREVGSVARSESVEQSGVAVILSLLIHSENQFNEIPGVQVGFSFEGYTRFTDIDGNSLDKLVINCGVIDDQHRHYKLNSLVSTPFRTCLQAHLHRGWRIVALVVLVHRIDRPQLV